MPGKQKGFSVYRHGAKWWVSFHRGGRRYQKPVGRIEAMSSGEAEAAARQIVADTDAQLARARAERVVTNAVARYQRRLDRRTLSTQENAHRFHQRLIEFFGGARDLETITTGDVEAWRDWLLTCKRKDSKLGNLSPKTVKEHIDWLGAIYNNAGMENPCRRVERPKKTHAEYVEDLQFFTPDEMNRMFSVCRERQPQFWNGFVALAYTGCRIGEIQDLRPEDLDFGRHVVYVTGKGRIRRPLMLTGPLEPGWNAIVSQIRERTRPDGFIFSQSPTWARKGMDRLCRNAFGVDSEGRPVKHGHPHMLRHTFASLALMHWTPAWPIDRLAKHLGHRDISTTYKIYGHMLAVDPVSGYGAEVVPVVEREGASS